MQRKVHKSELKAQSISAYNFILVITTLIRKYQHFRNSLFFPPVTTRQKQPVLTIVTVDWFFSLYKWNPAVLFLLCLAYFLHIVSVRFMRDMVCSGSLFHFIAEKCL